MEVGSFWYSYVIFWKMHPFAVQGDNLSHLSNNFVKVIVNMLWYSITLCVHEVHTEYGLIVHGSE